jgi:hypothetical protein
MENKNTHNEDWLSGLPKKSGFDVPEGYFDAVEDQFSAKLREESLPDETGFDVPEGYFDALEDKLQTRLIQESLPRESGFGVPEGYFDSLEDTILAKVDLPKEVKVIPLRTRILRISSIAAVFAIMLTVYFSVPNEEIEPTSDEIAAWIDENINEIDTEYIVDSFDEETTLDASFFEDSLESNTIENYLDEDDTYILIEESPDLFDETFEDKI